MNGSGSTLEESFVPDPTSECLNCGKPGTVHIDQKCPFEASNFEASMERIPFVPAPLPPASGAITATFGGVWGFKKVYK